jgi:SAM-dependent methyltransferase
MRRRDVRRVYDRLYADDYNERFREGAPYRGATEFELCLLKDLLRRKRNWLDVGCGTGYMLSQFPRIVRAGLDVAPAMLDVARREKPGAEFFLGDFLTDRLEWHGRWDLVSCMWLAYSYVETVRDVIRLIRNLSVWTSPGGACFVPMFDLESLCGREVLFQRSLGRRDGTLQIEAVVWSSHEPDGRQHDQLIAPHREVFVREFQRYFRRVEVVEYPRANGDAIKSRPRAVIARGRTGEAAARRLSLGGGSVLPAITGKGRNRSAARGPSESRRSAR